MPPAKMPKLTEINIKNLRGLTDLTLEDARVFNLLVGPSEIGKTTVLEGIFIASSFAYVQGFFSVNKFRGAPMDSTEKIREAVKTLFYNITAEKISIDTKIQEGNLGYSCNNEFFLLGADNGKDIPINGGEHKQSTSDGDIEGVRGVAAVTGAVVGNREVGLKIAEEKVEIENQGYALEMNGETMGENESKSYFPISHFYLPGHRSLFDAAEKAVIHNKEEKITEILQKINPRINKFDVIGRQVYADIGLQTKQPIYTAGSGLIEVLFTLSVFSTPSMNILLLDEIAFGLYYASLKDYLRATLRFAKEQGKQIFATTHRKDMIVALAEVVAEEEDLREDVMCYGLSRDKHGVTRAYGHNHKAIRHVVKNDIEIR